jgi:hypothetical protein
MPPIDAKVEFSEFQIGRIKRFAFGVNCLMGLEPKERLDPRKAKTLLGIVLDTTKTPGEQIPDLDDVLDHWIQFFTVLADCNRRDKRAYRLFVVMLAAAVLLGAYYWFMDGILRGVVAMVLGWILAFVVQLIVSNRYVWRGFSPLSWGLTHTEVRFALDAVINDPRWQDGERQG